MRKIGVLFMLVGVMALVLVTAPESVVAQSGLVYGSAYQIQNLESGDASVVITYYDQNSSATYTANVTVPGNGSKTIFPFTTGTFGDGITTGPLSFSGSAVLSSDRQIAAILNTQTSSSPFYGASTNGFSSGATEVSLPLIACNNGGFDTWFNVQSVGSGAAVVTVSYVAGAYGTSAQDVGISIPQYTAKTFNQSSGSTTGTQRCGAGLGTRFVGSAKVTSTNGQPIVASVMFLGTGNIKTLQGYNGFTDGATSIKLPLVMSNNSTYYTSIQVQNAGDQTTTVTVDYGPNTAGSGAPIDAVFTLNQGEAKTLIQLGGVSAYSYNDWNSIGKYVGGATITQTGTEPLVAVVNQNSTLYTSLGSTYEGFDPNDASASINLPLVAANNSGYKTGIQIQAVSGNPVVTVDYSTNTGSGSLAEPVDDQKTLSAGETWTLIQSGPPGILSGVNNWSTAGQYVGSAKVTATGGTVIAIVNFNGPATGDTFYTYTGFNQ